MKRTLVLGGIAPFCDLIEEVYKSGGEPIVCDYYSDAPAKKIVKFAYDVSTTDLPEIMKIANEHQIEAVISAFSDRNLMPAYEISQRLGLPTFYTKEIIETLTDKIRMKSILKKEGFPIITYKIISRDFSDEELEEFVFPVVIKPVDAYGSKGIYVCHDIGEVRENFDNTVKEALVYKNELIIEEYYPVDEISISGWVKAGKSYITSIYDVGRNYGESIVLSSICFPSKYTKGHFEEIKQLVQRLTECFKISEGPITVQCFVGERGVKVNEYIYRLAGGSPYLYSVFMGGPNIAKMMVDYNMGNPVDYQNLEEFVPYIEDTIYDYQIFANKSGTIHYVLEDEKIKEFLPGCINIRTYHKSGDTLQGVTETGKVVIRIFYRVEDREKESYEDILKKIMKIVNIYDDDGNDITKYRFPDKPVNQQCYDVKFI